jgi:hypothetical protein
VTTYISRDTAAGVDPGAPPPLRARTILTLNSAIVILVLGTILAVGGSVPPNSVR